ncbi:DUF4365 domain-containing protein [Rhizobium hidalgonense]|uniref:DUF4365 domain-containing protein n=1 Tax=Rhizobium hidalgonense TaxID=1538159 RepID=UPI00287147BA|nr:DUF4365 domain-containing protein [Rhizobium hidalgonense]MDR9808490.1 DUF4365 domain-containing protein [Rhizobium hidalgonense]
MVRFLQAGLIAICKLVTAALALLAAGQRRILSAIPPSRQLQPRKRNILQLDPATRLAIELVEKVFIRDFRWSFRRLPESNIGIDARAEILENGWPTGRLLPLQIRPISCLEKTEDHYIHRGEKHHLDYWARHSLPVCVIIVDTETGLILWQQIESQLSEETGAEWSIAIPVTNLLDASARLSFEGAIPTDPESLMRSAFALDLTLMEQMQDQTTLFVWDEWGDTTAIFCNLRIYIGEGQEQEPDVQIDYHLRAQNLHDVMVRLFPWASYSYAEPISEYSGEVAVHVLEVELRPEARAYLEAENFLAAGYPEDEVPLAPEPEDFITEEEEREFWRSRGTPHGPRDRHD